MEYAGKHDVSLPHKHMHKYGQGSVVWINYSITSGSLEKHEMLWEQQVVSDCFNNFPCSNLHKI